MKKGIQLLLVTGLLLVTHTGWAQSSQSEGLTVVENGNVGIGTTSPGSKLAIFKDFGHGYSGTIARIGGKSWWDVGDEERLDLGFNRIASVYEGSSRWGLRFYTYENTDFSTGTLVLAMRGNGNVGIGTTSPGSKLAIFKDFGHGYSGTIARIGGKSWWDVEDEERLDLGFNRIASVYEGSSQWGLRFYTYENSDFSTGTHVLTMRGNGNVGIGTITPNAALHVIGSIHYTGSISDVSDARLKENITPIRGALDIVQNINGVYFTMKDAPEKNETGFIAQNVQTYLPSAVNIIEKDTGYLGVSYSDLIPVAFEAIKEQQEQIELLTEKVEYLMHENRQIRNRLEQINLLQEALQQK